MRTSTTLLLLCCLVIATSVVAQPEITVGKISPIDLKWGPQTITAEVTNQVDYPKLVSALTEIKFAGGYLNPERVYRTNYFVMPGDAVEMPISFEIPMNFGTAKITLTLHDVVDSLDDVFPGQEIAESHYELVFRVPQEVAPYTQERITMPPMTENSPLFDAEYARIALWMFYEGKTEEQIAALANVDPAYFRSVVQKWQNYGFLATSKLDSSLRPAFVCLPTTAAEKLRPLAKQTSSELADLVERKIKSDYDRVLDSLIRAGTVAKDSNNFLNGGTVLYRKFPVIGGLLLWYDWGRGFIAGTRVLGILEGTDPCNTITPLYMYAVQGGDVYNGHHYFDMGYAGDKPQLAFADHIPQVICPKYYPYRDYMTLGDGWTYTGEAMPEYFMFDTAAVHPVMRAMTEGARETLNAAYSGLRKGIEEFEPGTFTPGVRYWFWNLVASQTLDELVRRGAFERDGNGHFRVDGL